MKSPSHQILAVSGKKLLMCVKKKEKKKMLNPLCSLPKDWESDDRGVVFTLSNLSRVVPGVQYRNTFMLRVQ